MAKFSFHARLSKKEEEVLLLDFFRSLGTIHGFKESAEVFQDLLSRAELTMLAKRLKIAKLLLSGMKYLEISREIKVSTQTIARVNIWLQEAGDGFRKMFARTKTKQPLSKTADGLWAISRRRHPLYHWPELLLKTIVATANRKQKKQLHRTLNSLNLKNKLHNDLMNIIRSGNYG